MSDLVKDTILEVRDNLNSLIRTHGEETDLTEGEKLAMTLPGLKAEEAEHLDLYARMVLATMSMMGTGGNAGMLLVHLGWVLRDKVLERGEVDG